MAADTAGAMGVQYPANVKFVRLPCTGKIDIRYILEAFEQGADGVYVVACPIGNCHHVRGNERGRARVRRARQILRISASMASGSICSSCPAARRTPLPSPPRR
jgi:F420-non-reducing hydrogenase iron-sulfur subunit